MSNTTVATPANGNGIHDAAGKSPPPRRHRKREPAPAVRVKGPPPGGKGKSRNPWPVETKRQAVDAFEQGEPTRDIAKRLGMHASLIYSWIRNKQATGDVSVVRNRAERREQALRSMPSVRSVGRPKGSTNKPRRAPGVVAAFSVTCYRGGNLQLAGYSSQQEALDAYVAMANQPGVERLAMWRALTVNVTVKAEVKE